MQSQQNDIIADYEPVSFDETVRRALAFCDSLINGPLTSGPLASGPLTSDFAPYRAQLAELQTRLSGGRLHFAVLGQFNRGKSTFINALLGMKTLPASVLPLTSVPTVIEYGAGQSCRIRFLDGKNDLVVRGPAAKIEETLRMYVAEENNPRNVFCVRDAAVACQSELLANGTVLIDTPGFGSTHLHNTKTTLDLLIECDAALFLLSADPPMTQTEMEFLRGVKERVPKIYFILNKVDLLTKQSLDEVDAFIRNILVRDLGFPSDTALYHTSAIRGEAAGANNPDDKRWAQSGLEAVRKQMLDFMTRDKYFTLSEALLGKYREAAGAVNALLEKKLNEKLAPAAAAREDTGAITGAIQSLSLELESELKKCASERDAIYAAIETRARESAEPCAQSMQKTLDALLDDRYFPAEAASVASALLPKRAGDMGARLLGEMLEAANKSLRSLALNHALAFENMQKRYAAMLGGARQQASARPYAAETFIGQFEIGAAAANCDGLFEPEQWDVPQPQLTDIFRKKSDRFDAVRGFYEPMCARSASANIQKAAEQAKMIVDAAWGNMQGAVSASYKELIDRLNAIYHYKQGQLEAEEEGAKREVAFLREKIKEIKGLMLV